MTLHSSALSCKNNCGYSCFEITTVIPEFKEKVYDKADIVNYFFSTIEEIWQYV